MRTTGTVFAALTVAALPLSAPVDSEPTETDATDGLVGGDGYTVYGSIADLPMPSTADESSSLIITGDVTTAAELGNHDRPDPATATAEELERSWLRLSGAPIADEPPQIPTPLILDFARDGWIFETSDLRSVVGWNLADVTAFAEFTAPEHHFTTIAGDFDDSTLPATLPEVADGVVTLGDGDDLESDGTDRTALDQFGRPVRLAQRDGVIGFGLRTEAVAAWADRSTAAVAVDDPGVAALARALDANAVVSAVFGIMGSGPEVIARSQPSDVAISTEIDRVAIGWSADDDRNSQITVAYHVADGDGAAAAEAAAQVERVFTEGLARGGYPIADRLVLDEVEVADGVVVATLSPVDDTSPTLVLDMLIGRELPFVVA